MLRMMYDPPREIVGGLYRSVLEYALDERLPEAVLVIRDESYLRPSARQLLDRLAPALTRREDESSWPGTELLGHTATVLHFRLDADVVSLLVGAADGLFDWQEPERPEDLCLLRGDGSPWLVTIAHERDAYFELADDERERLLDAIPALAPLAPSPSAT